MVCGASLGAWGGIVMCCSDPDSVPVPLDFDASEWVQAFGFVGWYRDDPSGVGNVSLGDDCDGLTGGGWKSTEVHWKRAHVADPVGVHVDGPNFRTVEIQDGKGQRIGRMSSGPAATEWPDGWYDAPMEARRKFTSGDGLHFCQVPDTERGRRAAWELEGS